MNCWMSYSVTGFIGANAPRDLSECFHDNAVRLVGSLDVRLLLRRGPDCFELLDQLGAGNDFDPTRSNLFDRAGIDARHVGDVVHGGILHGNASLRRVAWALAGRVPAQDAAKLRAQLIPASVNEAFSGQGVELGALDRMHDLGRLARPGDVVEPAA